MKLADALKKTPTGGRTYSLIVDRYLATMDDDDRTVALDLLNDTNRSDRWLAEFLKDNGYQLEAGSIQKWRVRNGVRNG